MILIVQKGRPHCVQISSHTTVLVKLLEGCKPNPLFWCLSYENQQKGTQPNAETSYIPAFLYGDAVLEAHSDRSIYIPNLELIRKRVLDLWQLQCGKFQQVPSYSYWVAQHHGEITVSQLHPAVPSDPWCWRKEVTLQASGLAKSMEDPEDPMTK